MAVVLHLLGGPVDPSVFAEFLPVHVVSNSFQEDDKCEQIG